MTDRTIPVPRGELEVALGAAFKAARTAKRWTLKDMSDAIDAGVNTIRWHEAGDTIMGPDKLIKAAALLDVDANALGAPYRAAQALHDLHKATDDAGLSVAITGRHNGHVISLIRGR